VVGGKPSLARDKEIGGPELQNMLMPTHASPGEEGRPTNKGGDKGKVPP